MENLESVIKKIKRTQIVLPSETTKVVNYSANKVKQLIPHRSPFLLLDNILTVNLEHGSILGTRYIDKEDPVFVGHFPENPIYPGVLQVEMMGQLGLCLMYFVKHNIHLMNEDLSPVKGLFTKIHYSQFMLPILPGDQLKILSQLIFRDEYLGVMAGQIIKNDEICSVVIAEVYFDD